MGVIEERYGETQVRRLSFTVKILSATQGANNKQVASHKGAKTAA